MDFRHEFRKNLLQWYHANGRRFPWRQGNRSLYVVLVSEILLWRTRAETIGDFYPRFFGAYPNERAIQKTSHEELLRVLQPLGLQNRRAKMLKNAAAGTFGRNIRDEHSFRSAFGIGQYVARATLAIYYDVPIVPVDVNINRLLERVFSFRIRNIRAISPREDAFLASLLARDDHKTFIWAMIDYSSMACTRANPSCHSCPFTGHCVFRLA